MYHCHFNVYKIGKYVWTLKSLSVARCFLFSLSWHCVELLDAIIGRYMDCNLFYAPGKPEQSNNFDYSTNFQKLVFLFVNICTIYIFMYVRDHSHFDFSVSISIFHNSQSDVTWTMKSYSNPTVEDHFSFF